MRVVLGYDESPGARHALAVAVELAARYDVPLVLVYATSPAGASLGEEFRSHREALEEIGRTAVGHAVEKAAARGVRTQVELVAAKPAEALLEAAERHAATVIVVGTYGETVAGRDPRLDSAQAPAPVPVPGAVRPAARTGRGVRAAGPLDRDQRL